MRFCFGLQEYLKMYFNLWLLDISYQYLNEPRNRFLAFPDPSSANDHFSDQLYCYILKQPSIASTKGT